MRHSTADEEVIKLLLYQDRYWITAGVNWKWHCNIVVYSVGCWSNCRHWRRTSVCQF